MTALDLDDPAVWAGIQAVVDEHLAKLPELIQFEMSLEDWGDPWASAMSWGFALNDVANALHLNTDSTYRPPGNRRLSLGDMMQDREQDEGLFPYEVSRLLDMYDDDMLPPDAVEAAVAVVGSLCGRLKAMGAAY